MKIVLGLSGGVDSAVAAHLLKNRGYDVTGVYLDTGCGSPDDAREAAERLGIGFSVENVAQDLEQLVIGPFVRAYLAGRTPNPCILCNPSVKFPSLLRAAEALGAGLVATGHYARVEEQNGRACLLRGRPDNDQSYMLSGLRQEQLRRCVFPLGELGKAEVREIARGLHLHVADKPDSMEICFIENGDHGAFIERRCGKGAPGDIVDTQGNVLGAHDGIYRYTVGQRRGLKVAAGRRMFVSAIDAENNRVVLSEGDDIYTARLSLPAVNWVSIDRPQQAVDCTVKIRHSKNETKARLIPENGGAAVAFSEPVRAAVSGQTAAAYDGDYLLAAGVIP